MQFNINISKSLDVLMPCAFARHFAFSLISGGTVRLIISRSLPDGSLVLVFIWCVVCGRATINALK